MQRSVARTPWTTARILVYHLFAGARFCHSALLHYDLLLFGHTEIANGRKENEQVQRETTITPEGDQIGVDRHYGVHSVLATVLDFAGGADYVAGPNVFDPLGGDGFPVGRLFGLLEFGH